MLFNEIYSKYFNTVALIIDKSLKADNMALPSAEISDLIRANAFDESVLAIKPALKNQDWQLLDNNGVPVLKHTPTIPLSKLQKEWLKAISLDPRLKLFDIKIPDFPDIEPLFKPEDIVVFDKYNDGDDYTDAQYQERFKKIRQALLNGSSLKIKFLTKRNKLKKIKVTPLYLEYSEKDDKFRLIAHNGKIQLTINLNSIQSCSLLETKPNDYSETSFTGNNFEENPANSDNPCKVSASQEAGCQIKTQIAPSNEVHRSKLTFLLKNERNTLERALLHFAHFETEAIKIEDNDEEASHDLYEISVFYDPSDDREMIIRILAFGPTIKVVSPDSVISAIRQRLVMQKALR